MIIFVFGVRDAKAQAFLQPFYSNSSGSAIRAFGDAVNDRQSPLGKHPMDYQLFELGTFDDNSGELLSLNPMRLLASGSDFMAVKPGVAVGSGDPYAVADGN